MSDGSTLRLPTPPPPPPPTSRARRRIVIAVVVVLAILALAVGADRAAAAYAENRIASQIQSYGFPRKPSVTVDGFPFLTQVISRHLDGVDISSNGLPAGPVTADVKAHASGIVLRAGYQGGTIAHVTGTALVAFSSIAKLASSAGAPGMKISADGADKVKLTVDLPVVTATAIARVKKTGKDKFKIHIVSAGGIPLSLLGSIRTLTIRIPALPLGLTIQSVRVTADGVALLVTGSNISFGH
jgi:DUF2993 family protein